MLRVQINELLLIVGTVAVISALPVMADTIAADSVLGDSDRLAPSAHSLGTLDMSQVQSSTAPSPDQPPLHAMQAGNITYLTGGIGDDERDQLDAMKPSYNLRVLNASTSGEYVVNTHVVLRNQQGSELLDIPAGPILLVSLPKGTYTLDASHAGAERTEQIKIAGSKATSLHFVWK